MTRSAIVTGGSAGIGYAIARRLVREGYDVTICGRSEDKLETAKSVIEEAAGGSVSALVADLSSTGDAERVVAQHRETHGGIDVLVNNAGVGLFGEIGEKPLRKFELEMDLNLRAAFHMLQLCHDGLCAAGEETGKALVVNVGSIVSRVCPGGVSGYAATKAGLSALSASAHAELAAKGVQVTSLVLGLVDTPGSSWTSEEARGVAVRPDDVAEAVGFLLRTSKNCFVPEMVLTTAGGPVNSVSAVL